MDTKYKMTMSLNVLNHLGLNLYSNTAAVISEAVANAYDADATNVYITIQDDSVTISDDGNGMTADEINNKYLRVGYQKRENGEQLSPKYKRPVMGRKGIGKLSLFSIANIIQLHSCKDGIISSLEMNKEDIKSQIKSNDGIYYPIEIPSISIKKGTTIIISDLKKSVDKSGTYIKKRIAKRFSIIGSEYNFNVHVNDNPVGISDRDFYRRLEFIWLIGDETDKYSKQYSNIKNVDKLNGDLSLSSKKYKISGWIGTVRLPSHLNEDGTNNNKISVLTRGKVAQEDILEAYTEGGVYADYIIGEISADFLDDDSEEDIATTSRQSIYEDDERFKALKNLIYSHLKIIQGKWTDLRNEHATEKILNEFPPVKSWYEQLPFENHKEYARKLFKTIDRLHFDADTKGEKRTLVRQAILAFEQLKIRENLEKIDKINSSSDLELVTVFSQLSEMEAMMYYDIASSRVQVIRELKEKIDNNELEKVLQKHIFDNLWLLNPAWERATKGTEYMESRIGTAFKTVTKTLSKEEKEARIDIGYRTAGSKHIIIELKRFKPSYKINPFILAQQIDKYYRALQKCLKETELTKEPYIETICIIGDLDDSYSRDSFDKQLQAYNGRIYPYSQLINEAYDSYNEYLKSSLKVSKLKELLNSI